MTKRWEYIQFALLGLLIVLGWQITDKWIFREETLTSLEAALCSTGNNRKELEKVLRYYQKSPADSLKYKAACFLISNMPYHYSYAPSEVVDSLKRLKVENKHRWINNDVIKGWKWFHYQSLPKVKDIDVIKADLLIENIEYAFKAWNKRTWSKYYSFEEFCEYILPYRVGDETLEKWRKIYYDRYNSVLDSLYQGTDVVEAARKIAAYLQSETFVNRIDFELPHMGALFLLENRVGYCRDGCDIASYVMRSLGIPVAMDQYQMSPSYNSRHFWSAVIDTTGMSVPFNYHEHLPQRGVNNDRKRGKVYRLSFGARKIDEDIMNDPDVPVFFRNVFLKDVTEEYYPDKGFDVNIESDKTNRYVYLSVYDYDKFIPIDMASVEGNIARFRNVETGLVYQPVFYKNGKASPAGYPFFLERGSVPSYFVPDTQRITEEIITRKYPMRDTHRFLASAVGMKFEGSISPDFRYPTILHAVVDTPQINCIKINFPQSYKCQYIRVTQKQTRIEIAEFEIFAKDKKLAIQKWGRKIDELNRNEYEKMIFDGKWDEYAVIINSPLFFDIGSVENTTSMVFIPRTDDNFIHLGDSYELFYQNGVKGWVSLGKQKADTTYLRYKNIPNNSILWLHNLTRGKEERPFYMKNGKQIFP